MLTIKNISKSYNNKKILDDISLTIHKGDIVFLVGESGSGKSTLLRILNNVETPDSGSITIDDKPINDSGLPKNKEIGLVFQHFNLFEHLSAEENITLPLVKVKKLSTQEAIIKAHQLLQDFNLLDKAHSNIQKLSGGQKQRLAIARTLALEPSIICFDEPTSALDPLLTNQVALVIQNLANKGYTIIITTHDMTLLEKFSGTVHLIHQGKIIESTSLDSLKKNENQFNRINKFINGIVNKESKHD